MSEFSDSSQNYQNIIANLLSFKKQWSQVPEVVYLTIKAIHNHSEQLEQNIYRQRQVMTEQSVRLKEIEIQLQQMAFETKKQPSLLGVSNSDSTRFKKDKKKNNLLQRQQSYLTRRSQQSPQNRRENRSAQKGLDKTMLEQVKALAEAIIDKSNKKISLELERLRKDLEGKTQEAEQLKMKLKDENKETELHLKAKMNELQAQINKKLQSQRSNMMRFAQQSTIEVQKILVEINKLNIKLAQLEQKRIGYSDTNQIGYKEAQKNQKPPFSSFNEFKSTLDKLERLTKDFSEFKLKTSKQMTFLMKAEAVESIVGRFQADTADKINKISQDVSNMNKQLKSQNESKSTFPALNQIKQQKKEKSSNKSLSAIYQSLQTIESHFKQKLKSTKKELLSQMSATIEREQGLLKKQLQQEMDERQRTLCDVVQTNYDKLVKIQQQQHDYGNSSIKKAIDHLSQQMAMARYLHLGERNSKDVIEWDKNAYNSMHENYSWKERSHLVVVLAAGLYKVEAGLYPDEEADQVEAFIVLNGIPIGSLKHKEVPPNCRASARGCLFNQALLLPAKSKIWIKTQLPFFGQAYLQILKL